ncbi:MAG: hlyD secretion family protein [Chlamydiales bacterium]|jgi:membrane fusion protein (multidrug efflux system)|nr:hlyD secretion family protein [Chlamydiales bacterium]
MDRNRSFAWATALFLTLGIAYGAYWWLILQYQEATDDAYVQGHIFYISPEVAGTITACPYDTMDFVEQGAPLLRIDDTDYQLVLEQQKANLAWTVRQVAQMKSQHQQAKYQLSSQRADLDQASFDYRQRKGLAEKGAISKEDFEQAKTQLEVSQSAFNLAQSRLEEMRLLAGSEAINDHPLVKTAAALLKEAYLNVCRCQVNSPTTGYIAQGSAEIGQRLTPDSLAYSIVPLDSLWVEANFKETQLAHIKIGQKVTVQADIYGSFSYQGKVVGIGAGSGSAFALIPPQNATGNWIKVIQRVPVKIALNRKDLITKPLRIGLSTKVIVDTKSPAVRAAPAENSAGSPNISLSTSEALLPIEAEIEKIIEMHGGSSL